MAYCPIDIQNLANSHFQNVSHGKVKNSLAGENSNKYFCIDIFKHSQKVISNLTATIELKL